MKNMTMAQIQKDFSKVASALSTFSNAAKSVEKATGATVLESLMRVETKTYTYRGQRFWIEMSVDYDGLNATIVPDNENHQFRMRISLGNEVTEDELKRLLNKYIAVPEKKKRVKKATKAA